METLSIPAIATARTWQYMRIALANPENDRAIVHVRLRYTVDVGAITVWLDHIRATNADTEKWTKLDNRLWRIDREAREVILVKGGHREVGYAALKLIGGDNPALLSADATANEIDDEYVIAKATELALLSNARGPETDLDARIARAAYFRDIADGAKRKFPLLVDVRPVA